MLAGGGSLGALVYDSGGLLRRFRTEGEILKLGFWGGGGGGGDRGALLEE